MTETEAKTDDLLVIYHGNGVYSISRSMEDGEFEQFLHRPRHSDLGDGYGEPDEEVQRAASTLLWPLILAAVLVVSWWVFF